MEYWEFLLQKEGKRYWQQVKSGRVEVEAGKYRVVAHSSLVDADVEVCVTHESTKENPPKRRSQKRLRHTNQEGLMVVIPFTYLKPGLWELRCRGDVMSDFLGKPWQKAVLLSVVPEKAEVLPTAEPISTVGEVEQADVEVASAQSSSDSEEPQLAEEAVSAESDAASGQTQTNLENIPEPEELAPRETDLEEIKATKETDSEPVNIWQPEQLETNRVKLAGNLAEITSSVNPIMNQSLQTLEQILQQVLDPVLQEFNQPEFQEQNTSAQRQETSVPESELALETLINSHGISLTLHDEALVVKRGEPLSISGQLDFAEINRHSEEAKDLLKELFPGTLCYQLRDPQTSRILLEVQQSLSQQSLPLAFNYSLEIPAECTTRLILGKVTLHNSRQQPLASQSFSIAFDLDELLSSILPGSQAMPLAQMLLANDQAAIPQEESAEALSALSLPVSNDSVIDLVKVPQAPDSLPLQPSVGQTLPPQLHQKNSKEKEAKSLQLPKLPQVQSLDVAQYLSLLSESDQIKVKQFETVESEPENIEGNLVIDQGLVDSESITVEASPMEAPAEDFSLETPSPASADFAQEEAPLVPSSQEEELKKKQVVKGEEEATATNPSPPAEVETEQSNSPLPVVDYRPAQDGDDAVEDLLAQPLPADSLISLGGEEDESLSNTQAAAHSELTELETDQQANASEDSLPSAEPIAPEQVVSEQTSVDQAFGALNLQDRFLSRLNSLATDAEFSEWLKWEPASQGKQVEVEEVSQENELELEIDETLTADFDESLWQEEEKVGDETVDSTQHSSTSQQTIALKTEPSAIPTGNWSAQEVVVEADEELLPSEAKLKVSREVEQAKRTTSSKEQEVILSSTKLDVPLPAPELVFPTEELVAGETVTVRVKLPLHSERLYVKLWLQDRQNRFLIDGPRSLLDFSPGSSGGLEALTQLSVPLGSAEIRFEAITVDLYSQRESYKVVVDRVVVSPDLPNISLEEFDP
ncbi:MAG: hypothetical protein WA919_24470 [Coleofasciculaceae cyanobacterium]